MNRRSAACSCGLALLLGGASAAQGPGIVLTTDPIVLRIHGPERIRAAFRATNVSELLGAREATDFWGLLGAALGDDAHRLRADAGVVDALVERLDGYAGTATVALVPHRMAGMRLWADGVLVLAPDGRTDLATIARDVRGQVARFGWRTQDVELGGATFPVVRIGVAEVALPTMVGDELVVLFGRGLERFVAARIAGGGAPFVADAELDAAPIVLRVDLRALVERRVLLMPPFVHGRPDGPYARRTGLACLRELRVSIRPRGPHVGVDLAVACAPGADRGALGALVSQRVDAADVVGLIPADAAAWFAGRIDAAALYDDCLRAYNAGRFGRDFPDRVARLREAVELRLGVELEKDVLARLDGAFVLVEQWSDPGTARDFDGLIAVARVREAEQLERALVSAAGRWIGDVVALLDGDVPRVHVVGDLTFCVHGDVLVIATGSRPGELVRDLATRRAARVRAPGEWPADVVRRQPQAPPGVQWCGAMDVRRVLAPTVLRRFGRILPLPEGIAGGWADAIGALEPHLEPFRADRAAVFTGWDGEVWRLRLLW